MLTDEKTDLNNSYNEDDVSSQKSSESLSDCSINIKKKIPEPHNEWKHNIFEYSATFNNSSDEEESLKCLESSSRTCSKKSSQNLTNISTDEEIFSSPEKSSMSNVHTFDELSFEQEALLSEEKIVEFKFLLSKVNDEYVNWKVNEFVLDTIKNKSTSWAQQIKAITKSSEMQCNVKLRSENGEITNLLGLEEEDIKLFTNRSLSLFSKSAFFDHAVEVVRANVAKLKLQRKNLQDEFGAHSMKVMVGMLSRERTEQLGLYKQLEEQQNQARQMHSSSKTMVGQLNTLRQNSDQKYQKATFELLRQKALYLHLVTSCAKLKLDQSMNVDENTKKKMDTEGYHLKTQVTGLREELKTLQKSLAEYEKRETESDKFKEIVLECQRVKKQLQHKYQTLNMLNDPNMSI